MADWPVLDALKLMLGQKSDDFDELVLESVLATAIEQVKIDVAGSAAAFDDEDSDPVYVVTDSLEAAARLLATRIANAPAESSEAVAWAAHRSDINYQRLLKGQRRSFGIA